MKRGFRSNEKADLKLVLCLKRFHLKESFIQNRSILEMLKAVELWNCGIVELWNREYQINPFLVPASYCDLFVPGRYSCEYKISIFTWCHKVA